MQLKRWIKTQINILLVVGCAVSLMACSSKHKQDQAAINDANAAYADSAEATGLGQEAGFDDEVGGARSLSKRVYYFDYDQNIVHDMDKPAILTNAAYIMKHPNVAVNVEGHTDPRGSREYNIGLGERRA